MAKTGNVAVQMNNQTVRKQNVERREKAKADSNPLKS